MATIFNANTTEGLVITPDTSGEMVFQSDGTQVLKVTGATGSFDVPVGTTAERPVSPSTGTIRYNTTEGELETYDGSSWTSIGASTWTTSGSNIYYNTGNVGIGTSSPDEILDVNGRLSLRYISVTGAGMWLGTSTTAKKWFVGGEPSTDSWRVYNGSTNQLKVLGTGELQFNSGYGSAATAYGCRAWVNWSITQTIRGSGNVSSITDNGVGKYTVNMTTAMPDTNYSVAMAVGDDGTSQQMYGLGNNSHTPSFTTSSFRVHTSNATPTLQDKDYTHVAVFR